MKTCPPREVKPPEWDLPLVRRSLTRLPCEPLRLCLDKHLTWMTCYLLSSILARRVNELHGLSLLCLTFQKMEVMHYFFFFFFFFILHN